MASYLAADVIKAALSQAIASIGATQTQLQFAATLFAVLPFVDLAFLPAIEGVSLFYAATQAGTLSDYTDAESDPTLWSDIQCAIFGAIRSSGQVDAGNYASVGAAIAGVSYAHPDVISTLADFWGNLGLTTVQGWQQLGGLADGDCTTCGNYCAQWDFTAGAAGWGPTPARAGGAWVAGAWYGLPQGGGIYGLDINTSEFTAVFLESVDITGTCAGDPDNIHEQSVVDPATSTEYNFSFPGDSAFHTINVPIGAAFGGGFRLVFWARPGGVEVTNVVVHTTESAPGGNGLVAC